MHLSSGMEGTRFCLVVSQHVTQADSHAAICVTKRVQKMPSERYLF